MSAKNEGYHFLCPFQNENENVTIGTVLAKPSLSGNVQDSGFETRKSFNFPTILKVLQKASELKRILFFPFDQCTFEEF
jgi:hypothetical protein